MLVHELCIGMTRSGKSHHAQVVAQRHPGPVLFFNPQAQELEIGEWTRVTPNDSLKALISLLRRGRARVSFEPHWNSEIARKQLRGIVDKIMRLKWDPPLLVVVDEGDQVAPEGKNGTPAHQIVQRGAKQGIWGEIVTQHPAVLSKTIMRQCFRKVIFITEDSAAYFKRYGWPGERIEQILSEAPQYSFLVWEARQLTGPHRH